MKTIPDSLQRFLFDAAPIRGEFVHLEDTWRTVLARHDYPPALRRMMGELVAAAALLAATLKLDGALILQIQGRGAVRLLVVECSGDLNLRATAKWEGDLATGTPAELIGDGQFVITLDPQDGGTPYQGIVPLEGASVAAMLENYMGRSEQLATRLWLAADGEVAAGLLLQKLPDQPEQDADAWSRATQLADTLKVEELLKMPAPYLLHRLYHEEDIRLFDAQPAAFACSCSRDNVARMLKMLGRDEVEAVLEEQGSIEIHCEFCNQRYVFEVEDVEQVFTEETMQQEVVRH
ncbi:MAG: Hsp33 family molecular chaperone HslO [Nitrosomonadales bacterium]|nr:Hsp33 family molecular chaperone HslO [Nitrosomonadales bacterium]